MLSLKLEAKKKLVGNKLEKFMHEYEKRSCQNRRHAATGVRYKKKAVRKKRHAAEGARAVSTLVKYIQMLFVHLTVGNAHHKNK